MNAEILRPMICDGNFKIFNFSSLLKDIRQCWHIENIAYIIFLHFSEIFTMCCVAKKESGKNFDWFTTIWLKRIIGSTFAVRRFSWTATCGVRKWRRNAEWSVWNKKMRNLIRKYNVCRLWIFMPEQLSILLQIFLIRSNGKEWIREEIIFFLVTLFCVLLLRLLLYDKIFNVFHVVLAKEIHLTWEIPTIL